MSLELDSSLRYVVYGVRPVEHEDDNSDTPNEQRVAKTVPICSTNDREEAKEVVRKGGFMHDEQFYVATGAKDTETGGKFGVVPEGV